MTFRNIRNLASVAFLQGTNFLLPAIVLPFLIRYLGPAEYGLYNLSQIWAVYFSMVVAYGFDLSGTKEFASSDGSADQWSVIYSRIFFSKLFLFTVSAVVFAIIVVCNASMREHSGVFFAMFLWTVSTLFFPSAFFIGIEKQPIVSFYSITSRVGSFLLILALIYFKASLIALVLAYSLPQALTAMVFHWFAMKKYGLMLSRISLAGVLKYLRQSFILFISILAGTITVSVSVIMLGMLASKETVGYFSVSTKLVSIFLGVILFPLQIVFFPVLVKKVKDSYTNGVNYFKKLLIYAFVPVAACCISIFFLSERIIELFVGKEFLQAAASLKIVCFVPMVAIVNMLIGLFLLSMDRRKVYSAIVITGTVACIVSNLVLIPRYGEVGASFAWLIAEMCCCICFVTVFLKGNPADADVSDAVSLEANS